MSVALTMTVRDESEFVRSNLSYHQFLGVEHFFVYDDGSTDATVETVEGLTFVTLLPGVSVSDARANPQTRHLAQRHDNPSARQVINTIDAMNRACKAGYEWLVFLDADELLCPDLEESSPNQLLAFFDSIHPCVEVVRFQVVEAVQRAASAFTETLFKVRSEGLTRRFPDPTGGPALLHSGFFGHIEGKSAVRLSSRAAPYNTHFFRMPDGSDVRELQAGYVLHYFAQTYRDFCKKFARIKNWRGHALHSPIPQLKKLLAHLTNELDACELEAYFREHYLFSEQDVDNMAANLRRVAGVAEAIASLPCDKGRGPQSESAARPTVRSSLPDFLLLGAMKAGTTFLYTSLTLHPCVLAARQKEIHYFDLHFEKGEDWYRDQFPSTEPARLPGMDLELPTITGEATPYYLFHPLAPERVSDLLCDVKQIVLLRDPIERAHSHYWHSHRAGLEPLSFEQALEQEDSRLRGAAELIRTVPGYQSEAHRCHSYKSRGLYLAQLERWMGRFPREQFLILHSQALFERTQETLGEVLSFLGLPEWICTNYTPSAPGKKASPMSPETRRSLEGYFREPNRQLFEFLGQDFGWSS